MIKKMDHIGIAVRNMDEILNLFETVLGLKASMIKTSPELGAKLAFVPMGNGEIEFVEPLSPDGDLAKFMEKRGKGMHLHHLCLEVEDLERALQSLDKKGVKLVDKKGKQGLAGKVGFLHPHALGGLWVELVQKTIPANQSTA